LPPGRARLATKPAPTGSTDVAITMGMVVVAFFAANGVRPPEVTIRSTLDEPGPPQAQGAVQAFAPQIGTRW